jgi:hypothetical protein
VTHRLVIALIGVVCAAGACGSKSGGGTGTAPLPPIGDDAGPEPAGDAGPAGLTEAQCDDLLDHLLAVEREAQAAELDPDLQPTDEQIADIRAQMREQFLGPCMQSTQELYDCAIEARTREAFAACGQRAE